MVIFYSILILFWIDTHPNILMLPIKLFSDWAFSDIWRGYPFMLLNGEYYNYSEIPKSYLLINILFRSPEYLLFCYFQKFFFSLPSSILNRGFLFSPNFSSDCWFFTINSNPLDFFLLFLRGNLQMHILHRLNMKALMTPSIYTAAKISPKLNGLHTSLFLFVIFDSTPF